MVVHQPRNPLCDKTLETCTFCLLVWGRKYLQETGKLNAKSAWALSTCKGDSVVARQCLTSLCEFRKHSNVQPWAKGWNYRNSVWSSCDGVWGLVMHDTVTYFMDLSSSLPPSLHPTPSPASTSSLMSTLQLIVDWSLRLIYVSAWLYVV